MKAKKELTKARKLVIDYLYKKKTAGIKVISTAEICNATGLPGEVVDNIMGSLQGIKEINDENDRLQKVIETTLRIRLLKIDERILELESEISDLQIKKEKILKELVSENKNNGVIE
ncbi:MAG: hypothetical protein ACTSYD_02365 [Candidatus Heimdallarchaeaceae archaeon]